MIRDNGCFANDAQVVKFSSEFCKQIEKLKTDGYHPAMAFIRYIVFWQDKNTEKEVKIILPSIDFLKT